MTTVTHQKQLDKVAATQDNGFGLTKTGVMILGIDLLGEKLGGLLVKATDLGDANHGLALLAIRTDNFPMDGDAPCFGTAYADTSSVAINLEHCWHRACVKAHAADVNLNFMGILWVNILNTLAHELDHLAYANDDRELYELMRSSEDGQKDLEKSGQAAGEPMMIALAKQFDIEPPAAADFGWFGTKLMDLFTNDTTKDLEWVIKARKDIEDGVIYEEVENNFKCLTFREFVKKAHDPDNEEGWDQPTTAVNLTAELDSGVIEEFKAEPVEVPVVEVVELEAEKPAAEAVVTMAAGATGQFVGAGMTTGSDEPDVVLNDQDQVIQDLIDNPLPAAEPSVVEEALEILAVAGATAVEAIEDVQVPLPPVVAAQQAEFAAAAATAAPPATPTPATYTPHSLPDEVQAAVMKVVWQTLYHHIFTKCEWQQNPQTGRFMFNKAVNVLEGVNIQHIIAQFGADNFIMEYDTLNANGQGGNSFASEACQGMIRGRLTKDGLPSYQIYLNIGGQRIRRLFVPQNPEKRNADNAYSPTAEAAAVGNQIAWIFRGEAQAGASFTEKCAAKITNTAAGIQYEVF
jgi:hypothetical protein